jgi:hypothetical protein
VQKLEQDRSASSPNGNNSGSSNGGNDNGCHFCGSPSHHKHKCPGWKSQQAQEKSGLSKEDWDKLNKLIKEKTPLLPVRGSIKDTDVFAIQINGKDEAFYCRHCDRYTKGATKHTTAEHRGKNRFPHDPNAAATPRAAPAAASAPAAAPVSAPAPAAACVAQLSPQPIKSVQFEGVPVVDSSSLFRACPETLYDFGDMSNRMEHGGEDTQEPVGNSGGFFSFIGEDYFPWIKE